MILEQIPVGQMQNFSYVVADPDTKEAAVVDPAWEVGTILKVAEKYDLKITKILLTHTHFDHMDGVKELFEKTNATVYVHALEKTPIEQLGIPAIETLEEGDKISIGSVKCMVLHTPGHTPGSVCYLFDTTLLTGDTLFVEGCGRVDLPGGDVKQMWESLQRLKKLDEHISVYTGHDYGSITHSTIAHEKEHNSYLRCNSFDEFLKVRLS